MTIEQAIQKAIDGGWKPKISPFTTICKEYFLDPLFWQSLGKAMGWEKHDELMDGKHYCIDHVQYDWADYDWVFQWHSFIDHLAEGKDAESFFENTLTK